MKVYQVIKHEYDSDDGHYDDTPVDHYVYRNEDDAIAVQLDLNRKSVEESNYYVTNEVARRRAKWEDNGRVEPPVRNTRGTQQFDVYSTRGIEQYEKRHLFTGDPADIDAIQRFADRTTPLTYYTYDTLRVL